MHRRFARLVVLTAWIGGLTLLMPAQNAPLKALKVGVIADPKEFFDGGCQLTLASDPPASDRYLFMSDFNGRAAVNINGRDVRLTLVRKTDTARDDPKKGDRSKCWYSGGSISVEVDYTLTRVCAPDDEDCEVYYYSAAIHIRAASAKRSIRAQGLCGV